jgi:N-acetylmuramoyl-L-alanine amidase
MLEIKRKISQYNHYDYNNPKFLVFHYVGAQGSTAANNATYFYNGDRQASAHYFVDDNEIWQSVEDLCGAWSVGNTRTEVNNQNSINIEMCCMGSNLLVTETTENNAIELGAYLMKKYNIPISNVRSHYDVTAKGKLCPNFANTSRWDNLKSKLQAKLNNVNTPNNNSNSSDIIYRVKLANGEQIAAFRNIESAKSLAQINKCNVYSNIDNRLVVSYITSSGVAIKPINYRVKRKNGEQLGAFNSLDNADNLAKKEKAIIYDNKGNLIKSYIPEEGLGYLNLKPHMTSWRVYRVDGPYTVNYSVGALAPAQYGGLSYKILEKKATDVYKIKTESFGVVSIYAPRDADSSITENPIY